MSFHYRLIASFCLLSIPAATQTPIQYGNTVPGTIECGQRNIYTLTATQGDKLITHVTETRDNGGVCFGVAACAFDQCVEVRDELNELVGTACTPLESNACSHHLRTQLGPLTLPRDGKYTISVRDANNFGRGEYALSIQRTNNPLRADVLNVGDVRIIPLQTAGEVRAFTFTAAEGNYISIEMKSQSGNVASKLALYGPNGDPVALPDGGLIQYTVRQSGRHVLLVFSSVSETGVAQLKLSPNPIPYPNSVISQIADGNGWRTTLTLVNHSTEPAPFTVRSWNGAGTSWRLAWDGPTEGTIPVGGSRTINTVDRESVTNQGWAELVTTKTIGVHAVFRSSSGQEASVAGITSTSRFLLPFDNTGEMVTSMALVNTNDTRVALVRVLFRDEAGNLLGTDTIILPPRGHEALATPMRFPLIRGRRGVAEFSTDAPDITALGLRFSPSGAFTSFPIQPGLP